MTRGPGGQPSIPDRVELSDADREILGVVNSSARQLGLVAPFALTCTYVVIAAGSTTHEMLLTGERLTLPLLSAEVPLHLFFWISGILIFVLHAYLMMQHHVLGRRIMAAERQLHPIPLKLRWQFLYPSLPVVRRDHKRHGRWVGRAARLLYFIALASPLLILVYMQVQILPSHREPLLWAFRILVILDACLIVFGWPGRPGDPRRLRSRTFWIGGVISAAVVLFSVWGLRTPDADCRRPKPPLMPEAAWTYLVDEAPWPWRMPAASLRLAGAELASVDPAKSRLHLENRDLRCADLRRSALPGSVLRGSDLRGARLTEADLRFADLSALTAKERATPVRSRHHPGSPREEERPRGITDLTGANLDGARLDGSRLVLVRADRLSAQGASFRAADLTGIRLLGADLRDADLRAAALDGGVLDESRFDFARLMAAQLFNVSAIGASFLDISGPLSVWDHSDLRLARFLRADLRATSWTGGVAIAALLHDSDLRASRGIRLDGALLPRVRLDADNVQREDAFGLGQPARAADLRGWQALPPDLEDLEDRLAEMHRILGRDPPPTDPLGTLEAAKERLGAFRRAADDAGGATPEPRSGAKLEIGFGVSPEESSILGLRPGDPEADLRREAQVYWEIFDFLIDNDIKEPDGLDGKDSGRWKHPSLLCTLLRYSSESSPYNRAAAETARQILEARGQAGWLDRYVLRSAVVVPREPVTLEWEGQNLTCYW